MKTYKHFLKESKDREALEAEALKAVDTEMYYDLMDSIGELSDAELIDVIKKAKGNKK